MSTLNRSFGIEHLEARRLLSFTPAVNYPLGAGAGAGAGPQEVVTADFNNDGRLDLATLNPVDDIDYTRVKVSVLLGDGAGGFGAAINSDVGANLYLSHGGDPYWAAFSLTVADFNNDGRPDLAMAIPFQDLAIGGYFGGAAGVSLGNGDGTFQAITYPPFQFGLVNAVASGDFNNDGNSDLAVTGSAPTLNPGEYYGYAHVLLGNGHGGFVSPQYGTTFEGAYYELAVGDLNRDGKLDAVAMAGQWDGSGIALLGNGGANGGFSGGYQFGTAGVRSPGLAVGDFTGDGIPDLAVAGDAYFFSDAGVEIGTGLGNGTFNFSISYSANGSAQTDVAVADFNGDGKLDAVTSDADTGTLSELLGNGNGALIYARADAVGLSPSAIAVGDFNGDGRPDVAATNAGSNNVSVLLNDGVCTGTKTFIGPGGAGSGGNWSNASNWSPAGVPTASDVVAIAGKSVTVASGVTVAGVSLTGGATLTVSPNGARVLRSDSISIDPISKLDLKDNDLIIDYPAGAASPIGSWDGITGMIQSGYNSGAWNGNGITTSMPDALAGLTNLAVAEATPVFGISGGQTADWNGQTVDATAVLVKYTYAGDANLDGVIDGGDYGAIDNFVQVPGAFGYFNGDFNYDGVIDGGDYGIIDNNIQAQGTAL